MPDLVLSRELKLLQDELAAQRQHLAASPDKVTGAAAQAAPSTRAAGSSETASPAVGLGESADEKELRDQFRDLIKEITGFVEDAEKKISVHPAMSVVAAMLLGILIGSLLARR